MKALIRYWTHETPSENYDEFFEQFALADWMSEQFYKPFSTMLSGKK